MLFGFRVMIDDKDAAQRPPTVASGVRVVTAKAEDTVQKVTGRYNANPTEVVKFNGLLPNSVLAAE